MTIDQELAEISDLALKVKANYLARLKAEKIAMLKELQSEIAELPVHVVSNKGSLIRVEIAPSAEDVYDIIQQKITELKESEDGKDN